MLLLLVIVTHSLRCDESLDLVLLNEFLPRVNSFNTTGVGLDYDHNYQECLSSRLVYGAIYWRVFDSSVAFFGFCLPEVCTRQEAETHVNNFILSENLLPKIQLSLPTALSVTFKDLSESQPVSKFAYVLVLSLLILLLLNILGTFWSPRDPASLLSHCCITKNFKSLFANPKSEENFEFIQGIRALASISIIYFHFLEYGNTLLIENRSAHNETLNSYFYAILRSGFITVDIFFIISGFLMSYLTIKEMKVKKNNFSWVSFFVRRYLRYLPILFFIIGLINCIDKGAFEPKIMLLERPSIKPAEHPWWYVLLMIHNLLSVESWPYSVWTWSVAADFQFYIMCSVVLYLYNKNRTWGYSLAFLLSVSYTTLLSYSMDASPFSIVISIRDCNFFFYRPITRVAPFVIGLVLGLIYSNANEQKSVSVAYEVKDSYGERLEKKCLRLVKTTSARFAFYFMGFILLLIFFLSRIYLVYHKKDSISNLTKSVWIGIRNSIFALGFCFFMFPMFFGYIPGLISVLKIKPLHFVSQISYTIYVLLF